MPIKIKLTILFMFLVLVIGLPICFALFWIESFFFQDLTFYEFLRSNENGAMTFIVLCVSGACSCKYATVGMVYYLRRVKKYSIEEVEEIIGADMVDIADGWDRFK